MKASHLKMILNYLVFLIGAVLFVHYGKIFTVASTMDDVLTVIGFAMMIIASILESRHHRNRKEPD